MIDVFRERRPRAITRLEGHVLARLLLRFPPPSFGCGRVSVWL